MSLLSVIALGWTAFFLQHIITGMPKMAATDAVAVVLTCLLNFWGCTSGSDRKLAIAAHLAMVVSIAAIFAVSMFSGQSAAMATWYLPVIPLFAAYMLGAREAVIYGFVAMLAIVAVYLSPNIVRVEAEYIPNEQTWLIGKMVLLGVLVTFGVATRRSSDQVAAELVQREVIINQRAEELAEARDDALAAMRAKDQFLANMSHEIRTPLNGIIGMTSVLLDADQPDDQREMVRTIQRSSTALLAVLNEILDFSKLEASAVVLERIPYDLRECVEDATDLVGRAAFDKGLDIYTRTDKDVPRWIEGDITYLRQVLLNLIGNAVKFTDDGEIFVHVSLADEEGPEGEHVLHFQVHDTGPGISEDKHAILFRSFSQVDASTARRYGGTGLGLAISKRLVELMGGRIWVDSEVGVGSTFHFTVVAPEVEAPIRPQATHERVVLAGRHAAFVGAARGSNQAIRDLMASWGLRVTAYETPQELPEVLDPAPKIAVVSADGLDAIMGLQDRPPTILLVELADTATRKRADQDGVEAVVFRPVRQRALREAIEAVFTGAPALATGPSFTAFDPTMGERLPARILIGEDNPVNQRVAMTVIEKLGYEPDVASDGHEVLQAVGRRDYDIIFLDLHMPGMDGIETTRRIRERGDSDREPWVVALTATVGIDQRTKTQEAGMNDFVSKPFDVQTLMVAIERWARETGADGAIKARIPTAPGDESPWDQLCAMFANSPGRLARLVAEHRRNGAELVEAIEAAAAEGDLARVAGGAHALKSSSAQFGSQAVSTLASDLERLAKEEQGAEVAKHVALLTSEWERADQRLKSVVSELRVSRKTPVTLHGDVPAA